MLKWALPEGGNQDEVVVGEGVYSHAKSWVVTACTQSGDPLQDFVIRLLLAFVLALRPPFSRPPCIFFLLSRSVLNGHHSIPLSLWNIATALFRMSNYLPTLKLL